MEQAEFVLPAQPSVPFAGLPAFGTALSLHPAADRPMKMMRSVTDRLVLPYLRLLAKVVMRIDYCFLLILLLLSACGGSSSAGQPETPESAAAADDQPTNSEAATPDTLVELAGFILPDHEILDTQKGDLNRDGREDVLLLLKATNEAETSDVDQPTPRPLLLLLRQPDNRLQLARRNDRTVYCVNCGGVMGDPYMGLTIKGGYFSVEHYGGSSWRWTKIVTYKYNPTDEEWYLDKDGGESFHASNPDSTMTQTVKTTKDFGVVKFEAYDIYKEEE